jgi:LmbE family N-acetylglucosaminyl deacetylase
VPARSEPSGSLAVVSPHLDDAVLSLGASIARWACSGVRVDVVTVLAGDPGSTEPASKWDARAGFATQAEAARARREEDRRACAVLGARPVWLPFVEPDADRPLDGEVVLTGLTEAVAGADAVLIPGFPLTHPDHARLAELLLGARGSFARMGIYREQPYASWLGSARVPEPGELGLALAREAAWTPVAVGLRDRLAKWRAARAYTSQLRLLGLTRRGHARLARLLGAERRSGGEQIAWLREHDGRRG